MKAPHTYASAELKACTKINVYRLETDVVTRLYREAQGIRHRAVWGTYNGVSVRWAEARMLWLEGVLNMRDQPIPAPTQPTQAQGCR